MKEGSSYLDSWRKERGQHSVFERIFKKRCHQEWLLFLVSPFGELVVFPFFVQAVLDLYCEDLSSHLRRLFLFNLLVGFV